MNSGRRQMLMMIDSAARAPAAVGALTEKNKYTCKDIAKTSKVIESTAPKFTSQ
jgi:hypothetical protein